MESCYRHPGRETNVSCSDCGRPICTDCMVAAPVGIKCPDCARQPRSARVTLKPDKALRAVAAVFVAGIGLGWVVLLLEGTPLGILSLFIAYFVGIAIGEVVLWAGGRFRGTSTNWIAIGGAIWTYLVPLAIVSVITVADVSFSDLVASAARAPFYVIGVAIAAFFAYRRVQ